MYQERTLSTWALKDELLYLLWDVVSVFLTFGVKHEKDNRSVRREGQNVLPKSYISWVKPHRQMSEMGSETCRLDWLVYVFATIWVGKLGTGCVRDSDEGTAIHVGNSTTYCILRSQFESLWPLTLFAAILVGQLVQIWQSILDKGFQMANANGTWKPVDSLSIKRNSRNVTLKEQPMTEGNVRLAVLSGLRSVPGVTFGA